MWTVPLGLGLVLLGIGSEAAAQAASMDLREVVQQAEAIAIVNTTRSEPCEPAGEQGTYRQRVSAQVRAIIKGTVTSELELLGDASSSCEPAPFEVPADYLVFLAHDDAHWVRVKKDRGALRLDDEAMVEWPYGDGGRIRLADALIEIRNVAGEDLVGEVEVVEPAPDPAPASDVAHEDAPCGLLVSHLDAQAEAQAEAEAEAVVPDWLTHPLAIFGGAMAVLLGLGVAWRGRAAK